MDFTPKKKPDLINDDTSPLPYLSAVVYIYASCGINVINALDAAISKYYLHILGLEIKFINEMEFWNFSVNVQCHTM